MNTNAISDVIWAKLSTLHPRVYRNQSIDSPTAPYIVYVLDSATPNTPSIDYYLNIDIFDEPHTSVRDIETLADTIQDELDCIVIRTADLNLHLTLEQRQFIQQSDLTTAQMINLRFVVRAYFLER